MLNQAEITTAINSIPWFFDLSQESINRLISIADVISLEPGHVIFSEGDQHPYFYLVLEGKVHLESFVPGQGSLPLFTAESLDVLGWSSLTPVVRQMSSTAVVLAPTKLLRFNAQTLMACCESDCELGFVIMRRLANIIASRLLTHRLHLLEIISGQK
ncbi:MAG: Crp/Fnr family transcriptional regulator [Brevefilum sp.]